MNIYRINEAILGCFDAETAEIFDVERYNALQIAREEKIENALLLHKNLKAEVGAIDGEIKTLTQRRDSKKRKLESLDDYISRALDGQPFSTPRVECSFRKSTVTIIEDEPKFIEWAKQRGDQFLTYQPPKIAKAPIKEAIERDQEIPFAYLEVKKNLSIK